MEALIELKKIIAIDLKNEQKRAYILRAWKAGAYMKVKLMLFCKH